MTSRYNQQPSFAAAATCSPAPTYKQPLLYSTAERARNLKKEEGNGRKTFRGIRPLGIHWVRARERGRGGRWRQSPSHGHLTRPAESKYFGFVVTIIMNSGSEAQRSCSKGETGKQLEDALLGDLFPYSSDACSPGTIFKAQFRHCTQTHLNLNQCKIWRCIVQCLKANQKFISAVSLLCSAPEKERECCRLGLVSAVM